MKLLVIGIDAMMPDILFPNIDDYPTLKRLVQQGVAGSYDGYVYGYGSHDNWTSIYTGLAPKEHKIIKGIFQPKNRLPRLYDYSQHETIWKVLNANGYKVGMWKGLVTAPPENIDGYMISGELAFDEHFNDPEIALEGNMLMEKDQHLDALFEGEFPKRPIPKGPENYGYTWEQIFENPKLIDEFLDEDYFEEGTKYLEEMLAYSLKNIQNVHEQQPVDLLWFYNGIFDYVGHFTFHDKGRTQIKKAFTLVDRFVEQLLAICQPENVLVLSDHGQKSYIDHFPNCSVEIQRESFGLADQCALSGDNIVMKARTGGFLSSFHSLKGTFILEGKDIQQGSLQQVRNLDIYPLILELFDCKVPENRKGLVPNVLQKEQYLNQTIAKAMPDQNENVLLIQTCEVNVFNSYINDYYNEHRFTDIYIYGPAKYQTIFEANEQVTGFIAVEEGYDADCFDLVLVPYDNKRSKEQYFIEIR